jgi:hypothetical protein
MTSSCRPTPASPTSCADRRRFEPPLGGHAGGMTPLTALPLLALGTGIGIIGLIVIIVIVIILLRVL